MHCNYTGLRSLKINLFILSQLFSDKHFFIMLIYSHMLQTDQLWFLWFDMENTSITVQINDYIYDI